MAKTTKATGTTVVVSKMSKAKALHSEITAQGYKLPEGKTYRSHFIDRAVAEGGMTAKGAATYYQNLSNAAAGQPLYKYNKAKPKAIATEA